MELTSLSLKREPCFEKVSVPQFGKDATVRIAKMTISGYLRRTKLQEMASKLDITEDDKLAYSIVANLMCSMVTPEGTYVVPNDDDIHGLVETISAETMIALSDANSRINPVKAGSLAAKKKKS